MSTSVAGVIGKKSQFSKSPRTSTISISYCGTVEGRVEGGVEGRTRRAVSCDRNSNNYTYTSYSTYTASLASKRMTATVKASNKAAILSVGEELRVLLHEEDPPLIKDRRFHLRSYQACFVGSEMVSWLLKKGEVECREEAVAMMQKLIDYGVVHHGKAPLCCRHPSNVTYCLHFRGDLYYRVYIVTFYSTSGSFYIKI